jgi:hypothetical protein
MCVCVHMCACVCRGVREQVWELSMSKQETRGTTHHEGPLCHAGSSLDGDGVTMNQRSDKVSLGVCICWVEDRVREAR